MKYVPGPPPNDFAAVHREFWRISQNVGEGGAVNDSVIRVKEYGAIGDGVTDDYAAIQKAINAATYYQSVEFESGKIYCVSAELEITKPIIIDGKWALLKPCSSFVDGWLMSVNETRRGRSGQWWQHPGLDDWAFKVAPDNNGFVLHDIFLEGNGRQQLANGLIFRGGNSDVELRSVFIYNFNGHGMCACDPDSNDGVDAENQFMQECLFENVTIKNCGRTGASAYVVGRNANGASSHNNLRHEYFNVVYSRGNGPAISIISKNPNDTGLVQELKFNNLFLHGNRSLAEPGPDGETNLNESDLMVINDTGYTYPAKRVYINEARMIEQEDGHACLRVNGETELMLDSSYIASAPGRVGLVLNGALRTSISNDIGIHLDDHIEIESQMSAGSMLVIGPSPHEYPTAYSGPNFIIGDEAWLEDVDDYSSRIIEYRHVGDTLASDTVGITVIGDTLARETVVRAWIVPASTLTANDTNYASIILRPYNTDGSARNTIFNTTRTTGSGGMGNWTANVKNAFEIPSGTTDVRFPGALAVQINKVGAGVQLPQFVLYVQLSKILYR